MDYEELQVAHLISQEKFIVELQVEMEKVKYLQEEQEKLRVSHLEQNQRHETELRELDEQLQQKDILLKYYEELQDTH